MDTREYHIIKRASVVRRANEYTYHWVRTDGLLNVSYSYGVWTKQTECRKSIKADAERLGVEPIIIL